MTARDIDLNRAMRGPRNKSRCRVIGTGPINNLNWKKARRLSNLLFNDLRNRRKLGVTQPFVDQIGVYCIATGNLRDRNARCTGLPADRNLFLVRPEPFLLTLFARQICPQDVHYQCWTLSTHSMIRQSRHAKRLPSRSSNETSSVLRSAMATASCAGASVVCNRCAVWQRPSTLSRCGQL
jgi:hypothetical protein